MRLIYNIQEQNIYINKNLLQAVADYCEICLNLHNTAISINFIDDITMQSLNYQNRGIDKTTDVLSFPLGDYNPNKVLNKMCLMEKDLYDCDLGVYFIGDTFISINKAKEQSIEYGHSLNREICYLLVHSILHLCGYDHIEEEYRTEMRKMEDMILDGINVKRDIDGKISDETLVALAIKAMERSYSPYSHFPVGACLLSKDGNVYQGCNIENAAYGVTMCAERTALFKAVSDGVREFEAIAICGKGTKPYPCGPCRQALNEFSPDIKILVSDENGNFDSTNLSKLLPNGFGPNSLL